MPVPFISAPFSTDFMLFLALWPVWWILGVEQLLPPFFLGWELIRCLVRNRGRLVVSPTVVWAGLLALSWMVPIAWLDRASVAIYLREISAGWSMLFILLLFANEVRTAQAWERAARGLSILAAWLAAGALIYAAGLWRGQVTSVLGLVLPESLKASTFFSAISRLSLGIVNTEGGGYLPWRLTSLTLYASSLSLVSLPLIPWAAWRARTSHGWMRAAHIGIVVGLLVGLVGSESRIAYVAAIVGAGALAVYAMGFFRRKKWLLLLALACVAIIAVVAFVGIDRIVDAIRGFFLSWRPGSWMVRMRIYTTTLGLVPKHPIFGWGVQEQIAGQGSSFSAGSHSSLLGMLFRHGITGLVLYIGLWGSIWAVIIRGLRARAAGRERRAFWVAMAIAMLCFNIREMADTWWWDQTLTMGIWTLWGLIGTAHAWRPGAQTAGQIVEQRESTL